MLEYDKTIRKFEEEDRIDFLEEDLRWSLIEYYRNKINYDGDARDLLVNRNLATKKD
jgi:hypothetical protein